MIRKFSGHISYFKDETNILHREDGPVVEYADGNKEWWYQGKFITDKSQEEFERLLKLKLFW